MNIVKSKLTIDDDPAAITVFVGDGWVNIAELEEANPGYHAVCFNGGNKGPPGLYLESNKVKPEFVGPGTLRERVDKYRGHS